jgi:hypothetical protein
MPQEESLDMTDALNYLDELAQDMIDSQNLWLRSVGQMLYTLADAGKLDTAKKIRLLILPKLDLGNGFFTWKIGEKQSFLRDTAFLFHGLARLEQAEYMNDLF